MAIEHRYITIPDQTVKLETTRLSVDGTAVDREIVGIGDPEDPDGYANVVTGGAGKALLVSVDGFQTGATLPTSPTATLVSNSSTTTPLNAAATFTGTSTDLLNYAGIDVAVFTDQNSTLYVEFSTDGTNWDSSLSYKVLANTNLVRRLKRTRRYFRLRLANTSASNQTFLRMTAIASGDSGQLTSALGSVVQADADTTVVRPMDFNLMLSEGLYQNRAVTIKDGINSAISTGTVPEDLSNEGGVYAGFPAAAAAAEIVVAGADTGTVYYSYMATDTDTDYTFGSKAVAGAGSYALGHNIWRCNYAYFVASSGSSPNVGAITVRQTAPNTAVVFCVIDANIGQSFCAAYTVPYGSSIYLDRINGSMRGSTSGSMEGFFYYKPYNASAYLRFPYELQFGTLYFDDIDYLIKIPERVDIIPRVTFASTNGLSAKVSYRFVKVKS